MMNHYIQRKDMNIKPAMWRLLAFTLLVYMTVLTAAYPQACTDCNPPPPGPTRPGPIDPIISRITELLTRIANLLRNPA
ncbi:hypothetical protein BDV27DRAFT_125238 [Aspergillus caelatus]|uniref:Uncharacterized protein n=1 Tax=Aspergillus caelatus TaxID=61420 RepID=A0A5N7A983_9EURO|nr:uncharacterized protein BDV27DRAFT_125238 [Aspergillus caelatus]KAE8366414.1 hypothetical protein BDV27DRAFT_125238 [Aspergillus caelatus]